MRRILKYILALTAMTSISHGLHAQLAVDTLIRRDIKEVKHDTIDVTLMALEHTIDSIFHRTGLDKLQRNPSVRLTEEDYREVAERLGVDVAAIKAVVEIEAGRAMRGFGADDKPIINFDLTMFQRFASRRGINLSAYRSSHAVVFNRPAVARYGSQQAAQHARLAAAREIDKDVAVLGTFWGMFQIGGFNWKRCGTESIEDFEARMSRSERDQLELFATFLENGGMVESIRRHDWAKFARLYNGPAYSSRGYHTRLARAFARYSE